MRPRQLGFTLIELMMSAAVGLVIVSVALAWVISLDQLHRRRVVTAQMRRLSATAFTGLVGELRQARLGVPRGPRAEAPGDRFPGPIVRGERNAIGFVVDLPRPDSQLNGLASLVDDQTTRAPSPGVALLDELNGGCDIGLGPGVTCNSGETSQLFAPDAGLGCHLSETAPTCPWALNKYRPREVVIVADGAGRWVERQLAGRLAADSSTRRMLGLQTALPPLLAQNARAGFLATPDRVFYRLEAGFLERNQCWGSVGRPASVGSLGAPCTSSSGTGWEQLAALPAGSALSFTYYDAQNVPLAPPLDAPTLQRVRRVDAALHVEQRVGASTVTWDTSAVIGIAP